MWGREYAFVRKLRQYRYTLGNTISAIASEPGKFHSTDNSASTAAGIHRNVPVTMVLSASRAETRSQAALRAIAIATDQLSRRQRATSPSVTGARAPTTVPTGWLRA